MATEYGTDEYIMWTSLESRVSEDVSLKQGSQSEPLIGSASGCVIHQGSTAAVHVIPDGTC